MKVYVTSDLERFECRNARDLLRQMRGRSPHPCLNQVTWMRELKRRVYQSTHFRLSLESEAVFVAGLVRSGLLKEMSS